MNEIYFTNLREANIARSNLWGKGKINFTWRIAELGGEVGELCNNLKKLQREKIGERGSRVELHAILDEAADVLICIDLVAMVLNKKLRQIVLLEEFDDWNQWSLRLLASVGRIADLHINPNLFEWGSIEYNLATLESTVRKIIYRLTGDKNYDIERLIAHKFNATSIKVGLPIFIKVNKIEKS